MAALTETVDFEARDLMGTDLAEETVLVARFKATEDNATRGDFFWT